MSRVKLYDCFNHWQEKGVIWVYSDTHFDDEDCKAMDINWPTPEEQVKIINSKVGKKDTLILLGDVGNITWINKIKGYKVLICGNHDKGYTNYLKKDDNNLFNEVYEGPLFISNKILLSHEAINLDFGINIHGHEHANHNIFTQNDTKASVNVCSNVVNYKPLRLDDIVLKLKVEDIHRITIDKRI